MQTLSEINPCHSYRTAYIFKNNWSVVDTHHSELFIYYCIVLKGHCNQSLIHIAALIRESIEKLAFWSIVAISVRIWERTHIYT